MRFILDMTLYHEGSDDLQLDWVDIETAFTNIRCNIGKGSRKKVFFQGFTPPSSLVPTILGPFKNVKKVIFS